MLAKPIGNLKLLTVTFQEIRKADARRLFMDWKYPDWPGAESQYHRDNNDFVWWIDHRTPECLAWFQGGHYGVWDWAYQKKGLVTVIVKMPITDGTFSTIQHTYVIQRSVEHANNFLAYLLQRRVLVMSWYQITMATGTLTSTGSRPST